MAYINNSQENIPSNEKIKFYKRTWFKVLSIFLTLILIIGGYFTWKTGSVLNKISTGGILKSLTKSIPGIGQDELKGMKEDRINVALLGMRGEEVEGGGLLADTIMVVSLKPSENKVSIISVPRDLYVTMPGTSDKQKINAVHHYGEEKGKGQGLKDMETTLGEVLGIPIHYAVSIDFQGFKDLINAVGGIEITLDKPFSEPLQFQEERVCDPYVFTKPTGNYEVKHYKSGSRAGKIKPGTTHPLCINPNNNECGGQFNLPAGKQTLDGDKALCYVRSRKTSSDFERAKRQQQVLQLLKDKLISIGTLTDFGKLNKILDALGNNLRTDLEPWELKKFYDLYAKMQNSQIFQRVLETSDEGLLYNPTDAPKEAGYILLPIGDNYDKIHEMAENIFTIPLQSDIKPK